MVDVRVWSAWDGSSPPAKSEKVLRSWPPLHLPPDKLARRNVLEDRPQRKNGTYSQSFAPNCLRGEQIGALFNSHSFCTVVVDVGSLEDFYGRRKGQLCSAIAFVSSLGALQKRIHVNLSWSRQEQRVFEETFTDWLWRLVRHVEDSLT